MFQNLTPTSICLPHSLNNNNLNFLKPNFSDLYTCLECIDWNRILDFDYLGLNGVVNLFYELILAAIDICVPKFGSSPRKFPHCYSLALKRTILDKKSAHLQWKQSGDSSFRVEFNRLRALCIKLMRIDYNRNLKNVQLMAKKDPKIFWKFINSKRKDNSIRNEMFLVDSKGNDGESIVNLFSTHFKSVYRTSTSTSYLSQPK